MASERKILANRSNARASTGPRTSAGKARSARNAYRHGLAVPVIFDPDHAEALEDLAKLFVNPNASTQLRELAIAISAAQSDLVRVRQAKIRLLSRAIDKPDHKFLADGKLPESLDNVGLVTEFGDVAQQLIAIDRYERRALSRRKSASRHRQSWIGSHSRRQRDMPKAACQISADVLVLDRLCC